jgi:DNA-directed RNA polymerase specialized sigma24 family protein
MDFPPNAARSEGSPAENSERRDAFREIDAAIATLGEPFRTTFLLVEIEDLPLREIAEIDR